MNKIRLLITAGPTYEPIDPVRFITNRSTGIMGYEIAREALRRRYEVTLISGPTSLEPPPKAEFIQVETADDMKKAVLRKFKNADCLVMAAAVSDFKVKNACRHKIKKRKKVSLSLRENPDILKSLPGKSGKFIAGFALETEDILENARKKLKDKKLDLIIANKLDRENTPFGEGDKNFIILTKYGRPIFFKNMNKKKAAAAILDAIKNNMT